jgi:RNA polymerase sigma-70 factor (ECF subfamily)
MEPEPGDVTRLLHEVRDGHRGAEERLITLVHKELRRLAASYLRKEAPNHSLQPTALVNEAYIRLTRMEEMDWQSRSHFFGVAAKLMRNILVDHARAHHADKRGQGWKIVGFDEAFIAAAGRSPDLVALDDSLNLLEKLEPRKCRVIELRFFSGMSEEDTAQVLGVSVRTVKRDWRLAKAWLYKELKPKEPDQPNHRGVRSTS